MERTSNLRTTRCRRNNCSRLSRWLIGLTGEARSVRFDVRFPNHFGPFPELGLGMLYKFFGCACDRLKAECRKTVLEIGQRHDVDYLLMKEVDDRLGRSARHDDALPVVARDGGVASLSGCRRVGQCLRTRLARNGEATQLAFGHLLSRWRRRGEANLRVAPNRR